MITALRGVLRFAALCVMGTTAAAPALAAELNRWDGNWHYDLAIYGWFPGVDGSVNIPLPNGLALDASASVSPNNYLSSLQFAAMLSGQARKGDAALFTDLVYADMADLKSQVKDVSLPGGRLTLPLSEDVNFGMRALVWTAGASYTVARGESGSLDLGGGFRYLGMHTSLDWNFSGPNGVLGRSGGASEDVTLWDGIVAAYGSVRLGDGRWFVPYYVDIGAGNHSSWTWMGYAGVGYQLDWGSVVAVYKNLYYDQTAGKPLQGLTLGGPAVGVAFRW